MESYAIIKSIKEGAEDAVAHNFTISRQQIKFANNSIAITKEWDTNYLDLFLSRNKRLVTTTINDFSKTNVDKVIRRLIKITKIIKPNKDYHGIATGPFHYKRIPKIYDKRIHENTNVDFVEAAINAALENSKKTAGILHTIYSQRSIATSSGISGKEIGTFIELSIRAFNEKDESGHCVTCSRILNKFFPEQTGRKAGEIAKLAVDPQKGEKGKYDVIFDPLAGGNLLSTVGRFSTAFMVESGFSFLKDKIGNQVANNTVTLMDDGRIPNGCFSATYDEEGVPTKRTNIIDKGILKTYLHNTSTAKKYNTETTGNAGLIFPQPQNIILKQGKASKENMFSEVKKGLYVTNLWYTRFQNYLKGDFSAIPRDGIFLIKNGEIAQPLKRVRISENLENLLKNIVMISNKPQWVHWWEVEVPCFTPYILVKNVNITEPTM